MLEGRFILKMKKIIAIVMSSMIIATSMVGCGKTDNSVSTNDITKVAEEATTETTEAVNPGEITLPLSDEKVTLTMYAGAMDTNLVTVAKDYNENFFFQELEKRTNVHIEFQTVPQGSTDTFNLMIASGELPDLISSPSSYMDGLDAGIDDGYYLDLTPYLDTYLSNYNKYRTQNDEYVKQSTTDSGRVASVCQIFQTSQPPWMGLMMRKDWLDELGLSVPSTVSEWETVLTAFKEEKGAYAPLALCGALGMYSHGYGVASSAWMGTYISVDGKVEFSENSENMKSFLTVMADWYKNGLIDPDFMTKQNAFFVDTAMVTTGQTGAFLTMYTMADMYKAVSDDPDFELIAVKNPIPDSGVEGKVGFKLGSVGGFGLAVSADSENKELAMKWIDYLYSDEGSLLANYGIEGDTFEYNEEGKPVFTEKITKNPDGLSMAQAMALYTLPPSMLPTSYDWKRELAGVSQGSIDMMSVWGEENTDYNFPGQVTMTSEENKEYASLYSNISTFTNERMTQFITGVGDINTEWDDYVNTINDFGIERCIEIKQTALDRFLNR